MPATRLGLSTKPPEPARATAMDRVLMFGIPIGAFGVIIFIALNWHRLAAIVTGR